EVIPDACVELILNFGVAYAQVDGSTRRELPNVCLIGLQSKPLILQANGVVKIVAVRFFAWGALPFFENEARQGGPNRDELNDALQNVITKIEEKVHAGAYQEAVERIEDFLIGKRLNVLFEPQQVQTAAKLLYRTKGAGVMLEDLYGNRIFMNQEPRG